MVLKKKQQESTAWFDGINRDWQYPAKKCEPMFTTIQTVLKLGELS